MYGWTAGEAIGNRAKDLLRPRYAAGSMEQVLQALAEHGEWRDEVVHHRRDGIAFPVLASIRQIKGKTGEAIGYVAINRDLGDRKRTGQ
jgi:PAS domain S-box-containing protein